MAKKRKELVRKGKYFAGKIAVVFLLVQLIIPWQLLLWLPFTSSVRANSHTLTARADWQQGYFDDTEAESKEGDLKLNPEGDWVPRAGPRPPLPLSAGTAIVSDGSYIYVLVRNNNGGDNYFMRYRPKEKRWEHLADAPRTTNYGADLVVLGNYIYAIFGGYQKEFYRYSIVANSWEQLEDTPDLIYGGGSLATDGTYIYALRGGATTDFWRYDPSSDSWSVLANPPARIYHGATLVYKDSYLYTPRGYNQYTFYRYDIANNSWSTMANAPVRFYDVHNADVVGDYIYIMQDRNTSTFYRYSISNDSWQQLSNTPQNTRYVGVVYCEADGYLYVFRGNGSYDFWRYDISNDQFLGPADIPTTPGSGADLVYYNGYLYMPRGRNTTYFYRYDLANDSWEQLANTPATFNDDTKGVEAGGYLYFFRGGGTSSFYRYDPATDGWTTLADTPASVRYGGTLVYPGSGDYIYATRGSYTRSFWRYSISGNSWDDAAVADIPDNAEAGHGARLVTDGTDIYYLSGSRTAEILKYDISQNTWTKLNDLPYAPFWGTDAAYYNGKIYVQAGWYKSDVWEYDISGNSWRWLGELPTDYAYDLGPYNGGSLEYVPYGGNHYLYSMRGQDITYMQVYQISSDNYPASGTWTSEPIDLTYVSSWTNLTISADTPGDSSVTIETRSSTDRENWSSWQTVSGGTISSPARRYLQIRLTLNATSDQSQTPVVHSLTVNYVGDATPPSNPTTFTGSSQQIGGTSLTSGETYRYQHPYFTWSGASDSETGVAGYYVYFGTDQNADPETEGVYQTSTSYLVTTSLSTGTYYLRLQTKDNAGNVSSATTGFVYHYQGLASQSLTASDDGDFTGTTSNISTTSGQIKLAGKSGFWLEERLTNSPVRIHGGGSIAYVASTGKLYVLRGGNTNNFYEYDIATDTWTQLANTPATVYYGGEVVEGPSGYLYAFRGYNSTSFWRYDIANDTWSDGDAADAPQTIYYGGSLVYDGSRYIYALRGNNDDSFLRYDTQTDEWETLSSADFGATTYQINNYVYVGGDLAFNGNDTIYAIQGNTRTGFAAYDIMSDSWTRLPNLPAQPYYGAQIEYDSDTNSIYYLAGWYRPLFYKFDLSSQEWTRLEDVPTNGIGYGGAMKLADGNLYVLRGWNSYNFYKYNISKDSWLIPTRGLFGGLFRGTDYRNFYYGADIVKGQGSYYYLVRGNQDNLFIRWDASTGETVRLADAPAGFHVGGALAYDSTNNKVYAVTSQYNQKFYVYDVATDTWSEITTDPPPYTPEEGSSLAYDGSRYIYWIRGNWQRYFYRYDTQGTAGDRWERLEDTPATLAYGAELVYKDGYIYTLRGANVTPNPLYRYDPTTDSWTTLSSVPDRIYNDGFLVDGGGDYLYACRGGNTTACYRYSISNDSWEAIADAPAQINEGGAAASDGESKIYVIAGGGSNTYQDGIYTYVMETSNSSFEESGSYISPVHDLTAVYKFANLTLTYTPASNTTLTVYTRTSEDNQTWSSWAQATSEKVIGNTYTYKINSPARRYFQVKFELTSGDGIYSGTIDDYTVNYYQDTQKPTNPTSLTAYSTATKSATLTSNHWYNFETPLFDWPEAEATGGATDTATGSGVAGYYVYFGTDEDADPETEGSWTTETEYTPSDLTSGETYYLRIKTKDSAGNVSEETWAAFVYKFDNEPPANPQTVTVDPPGYSATSSFDFAWEGATDSASGVVEYCYKTGAEDAVETCISEASVSGIPAYRTGVNAFYVRAKDAAGNVASQYSTASYYYNSTAPSPPQNLTVTPESNTLNEFAFSWDPPASYYGSQDGLRYYYSINNLPTADNVNDVGLTNTYLPAGPYATQRGVNYFYVVAKDEAGNIDYSLYSVVEFYADTSAPGIPQDVEIGDLSVKATKSWRLAISWDPPESTGSGIASYRVYRSTVENADCRTNFSDFSLISTTTTPSYVDANLVQQTYYYCVTACNSTGDCSAVSDTVSKYPDGRWLVPPDLTASPSATVKTKSAIITWSTSRTCNSFVQYGTSSGEYGDEVGSSEHVTSHEVELTGLEPGTTYYYKALWTDEDGNTGESDEYTFTTNPAPTVSSVKVSDISLYSAYVTFTIANATKAKVQYGKTTSYGGVEELSVSKEEGTYTVKLDNLDDGTLYHFRIVGTDEEDNEFVGDDYTFETLPVPKITKIKAQQVVGMPTATVRLLWTSNTNISSIVTYYPTANPEQARDKINLKLVKKHQMIIKDLKDETDYTFIVKGKDVAGNEAKSKPITLKTATDVRAPEISNLNVETTITGAGEEARAQIIISWDTDEPSTTQVEYGEGTGTSYSAKTQEDTNLTMNHVVTIPDLAPSKVYHLRALSKDKAGNLAQSFDTVVITPKASKSALNLVIENLSKTFGFLNNLSPPTK